MTPACLTPMTGCMASGRTAHDDGAQAWIDPVGDRHEVLVDVAAGDDPRPRTRRRGRAAARAPARRRSAAAPRSRRPTGAAGGAGTAPSARGRRGRRAATPSARRPPASVEHSVWMSMPTRRQPRSRRDHHRSPNTSCQRRRRASSTGCSSSSTSPMSWLPGRASHGAVRSSNRRRLWARCSPSAAPSTLTSPVCTTRSGRVAATWATTVAHCSSACGTPSPRWVSLTWTIRSAMDAVWPPDDEPRRERQPSAAASSSRWAPNQARGAGRTWPSRPLSATIRRNASLPSSSRRCRNWPPRRTPSASASRNASRPGGSP